MRLTPADVGRVALTSALAAVLLAAPSATNAQDKPAMNLDQLASIRTVRSIAVSPDGSRLAYQLSVPRRPGVDEDGPAWAELHCVPFEGGRDRAFVRGEVNVSAVRFSPDGRLITYLAKRGDDEHRALWAIPVDGGESRKMLEFESDIRDYRLSPDGGRVAFVADEPEPEARERARKKGYKQKVFEEDWLPSRVWIAPLPPFDGPAPDRPEGEAADSGPRALELEGSVLSAEWSPDGGRLALAVAPRPLVDDSYMFQRIQVHDATSGERLAALDNPGKLGRFAFSPDGAHVAMISGEDPSDPADGRLLVASSSGGPLRDLLPELEGHVSSFAWRDGTTLAFLADIGVETHVGELKLGGSSPEMRLSSGTAVRDGGTVPVLTALSLSADGRRAAFIGETGSHPAELFAMGPEDPAPRRLTDSNPWLDGVALATQELFEWTARDGLELQGILIRPFRAEAGDPPPLIMSVHGGPEAHVRNGWNTYYSSPGQVAAGQGYAVFYPNYRGSTGRGVAFSKLGQGDAAGKEFDDLIDALDALIARGLADGERVGITGGSYGGYATAWCATRFSERFRAGVMFVGISNKLSKALTTDIPYEDMMVHTLYDPWTRASYGLERSPLSYVEQGRTPLLIAGGTSDTRVHPSQSLQFYRALKLIGKTPVRYVTYPGEGHGNRNAAARDDYARRLMRWMNHFLIDGAEEPPPWDLGLGAGAPEEKQQTE